MEKCRPPENDNEVVDPVPPTKPITPSVIPSAVDIKPSVAPVIPSANEPNRLLQTKETIQQGEDFVSFSKQVSLLKSKAKEMKYDEIIRLCEELEEISPKYIQL